MFLRAVAGLRAGFGGWRRSRPFWAGVWTLLAGLEILSIPLAPLSLMIHEGIAGVSGVLMGVFLVVLALALWLAPRYRVFAGIATLVFAVASLVLSNFGGFLIGFLLAALGGAMAVSWTPDGPPPRGPAGQPGLAWPRPGDEGPDGPPDTGPDTGPDPGPGGGPSGGGPADPEPGAPQGAYRWSHRRGVPRTGNRLRALGVLPAGGALLAGLQPLTPATAPVHPGPATRPPTTPSDAADPGAPRGGGQLTLCSLLDTLLATAGPTVHVDGLGGPVVGARGSGPHGHGGGPPGPRPAPGGPPPGRRTPGDGRAPARNRAGGGLLGTVTGLLGLNGPPPARRSGPRPWTASGPAASRPPHTPAGRARVPAARTPASAAPGPRAGADDVPAPSLLSLRLPGLPLDHGMDGLLSALPPALRLGAGARGAAGASPWCLPRIELGLSPGAARYGAEAIASQPFRVRTPLLVLTGLTYHGITSVPTRSGPQRVLAFTAYRVDIASLRQSAALLAPGCGRPPGGFPPFHGLPGLRLPLLDMGLPGVGRVDPVPPPWAPCQGESATDGAPGGTTTANGQVVLLTKVLSGNLLGLLPVAFTPDMPPPLPPGLTVPLPLFFTDVTGYNQYLSADELTVPGLRQTASRP